MVRFLPLMGGLIALAISLPTQAEITGKPRVVDGDTLAFGGREIDLFGIDAPEEGQTCAVGGKAWNCGQEAAFALAFETAEHWVRCEEKTTDAAGRPTAICFVGPYDLNALMVRKGWALADRNVSADYVDEEAEAQQAGVGLWRGDFVAPWDWRAGRR